MLRNLSIRSLIVDIVSFSYILLFVYTSVDKWLDFPAFKRAMNVQQLPGFVIPVLTYILIPLEIIAAVLLMFRNTLSFGLYMSTGLMACFTIYIGLAVANVYETVPCTCAGVFMKMTWEEHLIFNSAFLVAGLLAIWLHRRNKGFNTVVVS